MRKTWDLLAGFLFLFLSSMASKAMASSHKEPKKVHGIAARGLPKYTKTFKHYDFVKSNAPKKGKIILGEVGSFDSLNPWILKGVAAQKISLTRATLLGRSPEEPFTMYGVVAESIEFPDDRSWIIFNIRPMAKWDGGKPITAEDVIFSYQTWLEQGQPFMKTFYTKIQKVEKLSDRKVKFTFDPQKLDQELPLIMGMMPLLPKDVYKGQDLSKIALKPLVSNGPYRIKSFEAGRYIIYERVKDFWGKDLPTYKGRFNLDEIRLDYYLNSAILFEAFKSGKIDMMEEQDPQKWRRNYNFPASKHIKKEEIPHQHPVGMSAFVYNTRRDIFKDSKVREALTLVFDFEHLNNSLFYGMCTRTRSFFDHTELMPQGKPKGKELQILHQYKNKVNPKVFEGSYIPPINKTPAEKRANTTKALKLLSEAGWHLEKGTLIHNRTKKPFIFELLLKSKEYEKIALEFTRNLKALGVKVSVRVLDDAQYERRKIEFDFDMLYHFYPSTRSPGSELINYISSKAADIQGSRNYPGIRESAIDSLIQTIIKSRDRKIMVDNVKVLDRILMAGNYVLPLFHLTKDMIAYQDRLDHPKVQPFMESRIESWWEKA